MRMKIRTSSGFESKLSGMSGRNWVLISSLSSTRVYTYYSCSSSQQSRTECSRQYRYMYTNDLANSLENCARRCTSHVNRKETLTFLFGRSFQQQIPRWLYFLSRVVRRVVSRMKVKTSYSLSFRPLPVFGHRMGSSSSARFRGSIDFCHPAGDFLHATNRDLTWIDPERFHVTCTGE